MRLTNRQRQMLEAYAQNDGDPRANRDVVREMDGNQKTKEIVFRLMDAGFVQHAGYDSQGFNLYRITDHGRYVLGPRFWTPEQKAAAARIAGDPL